MDHTVTFTVTRSCGTGDPASVDVALDGASTASPESDFADPGFPVTVDFGQDVNEETVEISVSGDTMVEPDETIVLALENPSTGAELGETTSAAHTVENDDGATLSIDDVALPEGDSGTTSFVFTVTLDQAVAEGFTVDFATADGSATTADGDYTATSGTLTFAGTAGETQQVTVPVTGDTTVEPDETFTVELSSLQAGGLDVTLADPTGLGTVENDDGATLSIDEVALPEGDSGTTSFVFTVTLDQAVAGGFTVDFATADGSATTADGDYTATSGTLTFAGTAGETQQVTVPVTGDTTVEPDETFTVELSNLQAGGLDVTLADPTGLGTIEDDDAFKADVVGTKEVTGGDLARGGTVVYTVVLTNLGPGLQLDNPEDEFIDVLPAELELVSAAADSGTANADPGNNTVTWNGEIPADDSVTIVIEAAIPEGTPLDTGIANQGTIQYDADGFTSNEATRPTDDPATADPEDPTGFVVLPASVLEIPTLGQWALWLLALTLAGLGAVRLRG